MGHHNRHYSGDPHAVDAYWGPPTSKANFCEEDYAITLYIAEFINTLSNLAYIYFAIRNPGKPSKQNGSTKFDFLAISMIVLGINSFIFHATLHQTTQFGDDLSMLLLGAALVNGVYTIDQSTAASRTISVVIFVAVSTVTGIYLQTADILFHVFSFNSMLALVGLRTFYLVYGRGLDAQVKSRLLRRCWGAVVSLIVAYTLWNIDLEMCLELRKVRDAIGLPWSWLLELHGWWHILTALGASEYIKLIRDMDEVSPFRRR